MTLFEQMWRLRESFRACFRLGRWFNGGRLSDDGARVLRSLAQFCYANTSTFDTDPRLHAKLEGRREVWLEIQRVLDLDDLALLRLKESEDD